MRRAYQLADYATNEVKTNPKVGAVLVYKDIIIGEGYHKQFGSNHAEVNAINSVKSIDKKYIKDSILYVTLEPCCFYGKTPACTDLIIKNQIKIVVVDQLDPNPKVSGKGLEILRNNDVQVILLSEFHNKTTLYPFYATQSKRPYIILKWASSKDNKIGAKHERLNISNPLSNVYTHYLRSSVDGIVIGSNTLSIDSPKLNTRYIKGSSPIRIVLGNNTNNRFKDELNTDIYVGNHLKNKYKNSINIDSYLINDVLRALYDKGIYSLLIEGGKKILQSFIKENVWDEAIVIKSKNSISDSVQELVSSPFIQGKLINTIELGNDSIYKIKNGDICFHMPPNIEQNDNF